MIIVVNNETHRLTTETLLLTECVRVMCRTEFSVQLKTLASDGVVFYMSNPQHIDFIALYLKDGKLSFAFNCGSGVARATTAFSYNDDYWHTVSIHRPLHHCLAYSQASHRCHFFRSWLGSGTAVL